VPIVRVGGRRCLLIDANLINPHSYAEAALFCNVLLPVEFKGSVELSGTSTLSIHAFYGGCCLPVDNRCTLVTGFTVTAAEPKIFSQVK